MVFAFEKIKMKINLIWEEEKIDFRLHENLIKLKIIVGKGLDGRTSIFWRLAGRMRGSMISVEISS